MGTELFSDSEFQGYIFTQEGVLSLEDDTHASTAELLSDFVVRDGLADHSLTPSQNGCDLA